MKYADIQLNKKYAIKGSDGLVVSVINRYTKGILNGKYHNSDMIFGNMYNQDGDYVKSGYVEVSKMEEIG